MWSFLVRGSKRESEAHVIARWMHFAGMTSFEGESISYNWPVAYTSGSHPSPLRYSDYCQDSLKPPPHPTPHSIRKIGGKSEKSRRFFFAVWEIQNGVWLACNLACTWGFTSSDITYDPFVLTNQRYVQNLDARHGSLNGSVSGVFFSLSPLSSVSFGGDKISLILRLEKKSSSWL